MVPELDIRNANVSLIQGVPGAGLVYNRLRLPSDALLHELHVLTVDDAGKINVAFVRWVGFEESEFGDRIAEQYEVWFYRGVVDADDGADSESELVLFIQNCRDVFRLNSTITKVTTVSALQNTDELGGYLCHRFIARLMVSVEEC